MEEQEREITLKELIQSVREYWEYLLIKWKLVVIGGVVGGLLGLAVSFMYSPKYTATVSVMVDDASSAGGLMGLASSLGVGAGKESPFSIPNIIALFSYRNIVESALLRPIQEKEYNNRTYADLYIAEYKLNKGWEDEPELKDIRFRPNEDRSKFGREKDSILGEIYAQIIKKRIAVSQPDKKTSLIQVNVTTRNEIFSKNFAEEITNTIAKYYYDFKTQKAQKSVNALQYQADSVKVSLYASMGGAASSLDQIFGLNPAMSLQKITSTKEQVQVQMNIAVLQELVKNLEMSKMDLLNNTPVIHIVDTPRYPLEVKEIKVALGIVGGLFLGGFFAMMFLLVKRYLEEETAK